MSHSLKKRIRNANSDEEIASLANFLIFDDIESILELSTVRSGEIVDFVLAPTGAAFSDERAFKLMGAIFRCLVDNPCPTDDDVLSGLFYALYDKGVIAAKLGETIGSVSIDPSEFMWFLPLYLAKAHHLATFDASKALNFFGGEAFETALIHYINEIAERDDAAGKTRALISPWSAIDIKAFGTMRLDDATDLGSGVFRALVKMIKTICNVYKEKNNWRLAWAVLNGFNHLPNEVFNHCELVELRKGLLVAELERYTRVLKNKASIRKDAPAEALDATGERVSLEPSPEALESETSILARQRLRRSQVEALFFDPSRSRDLWKIKAITINIIKQRYRSLGIMDLEPIKLDGKSARQLIMAEVLYFQVLNRLTNKPHELHGIPKMRQENETINPQWYGPIERYQFGAIEFKQELALSTEANRFGRCLVRDLGAYSVSSNPSRTILAVIHKLCLSDRAKERQLAGLFQQKSHHLSHLTTDELERIHPLHPLDDKDFRVLNLAMVLMLWREPVQWFNQLNGGKAHNGLSVGFALFYKALLEGRLTFAQYMEGDRPEFGIYTFRGLASQLRQAQDNVEKIAALDEETSPVAGDKPKVGQKRLRLFMHEVYGGHEETDNEADYQSEEECRPSKR